MKKIVLSLVAVLFIASNLQAQKFTDKIVLTKGQKIKMTTAMKSDISQAQRGDMKSDLTIVSEIVVDEITAEGYKVTATMNTAKMDFEGFGMKAEYDSEDPQKRKGQMAQGFEKVLGKAEKMELDKTGKVINKQEKEDEGMMRMMMGGADATTAVEGAFLLIPVGTKVGDKWRTTTEKDGLKVITEYTYQGNMGTVANLTANQQSKGEVAGGRGGQFTTNVNQLTQMVLAVDLNSGLISMKEITTKDKSSTVMGEETYDSTGTINTTVTCE